MFISEFRMNFTTLDSGQFHLGVNGKCVSAEWWVMREKTREEKNNSKTTMCRCVWKMRRMEEGEGSGYFEAGSWNRAEPSPHRADRVQCAVLPILNMYNVQCTAISLLWPLIQKKGGWTLNTSFSGTLWMENWRGIQGKNSPNTPNSSLPFLSQISLSLSPSPSSTKGKNLFSTKFLYARRRYKNILVYMLLSSCSFSFMHMHQF